MWPFCLRLFPLIYSMLKPEIGAPGPPGPSPGPPRAPPGGPPGAPPDPGNLLLGSVKMTPFGGVPPKWAKMAILGHFGGSPGGPKWAQKGPFLGSKIGLEIGLKKGRFLTSKWADFWPRFLSSLWPGAGRHRWCQWDGGSGPGLSLGASRMSPEDSLGAGAPQGQSRHCGDGAR